VAGEWRMVIAVRRDLGLGRGKLAAQAAHAAVTRALAAAPSTRRAWLADGQPKVVVRVESEAELGELCDAADWSGAPVPRRLTRRLEEAADGAGIAYQREVLFGGGTDAWAIGTSGRGVLAGCVSVPSRYIHSAVGCVHLDDLEGAAGMVLAFLESLREQPLG